jgi:acetyl-CoA C-acetyltransferase
MTDIVIASAARTPVGSFNGAFATLPAHALGTVAIQAALQRAGVKPDEVDEAIIGQRWATSPWSTP